MNVASKKSILSIWMIPHAKFALHYWCFRNHNFFRHTLARGKENIDVANLNICSYRQFLPLTFCTFNTWFILIAFGCGAKVWMLGACLMAPSAAHACSFHFSPSRTVCLGQSREATCHSLFSIQFLCISVITFQWMCNVYTGPHLNKLKICHCPLGKNPNMNVANKKKMQEL